jgi:hypothetical protein
MNTLKATNQMTALISSTNKNVNHNNNNNNNNNNQSNSSTTASESFQTPLKLSLNNNNTTISTTTTSASNNISILPNYRSPIKQTASNQQHHQKSAITPTANLITSTGVTNQQDIPNTPFTTVSTLTPDSSYRQPLLWSSTRKRGPPSVISDNRSEMDKDNEDDDDDNDEEELEETLPSSSLSLMNGLSGGGREGDLDAAALLTPEGALQQSLIQPSILIGWKIMVPGYGAGLIVAIKKKKFSSTKYMIQFDQQQQLIALKLQRSKTKGNIPFTLIKKLQ